MLKRIALLAALASSMFAAGTCTTSLTKITAPNPQVPNLDGFIARMTCTADAADGSYPNTNLPRSSNDITDTSGLYVYQAISNPGSPAPTDNWDYTLIADTGLDYMGGNGADRDTTTTELEVPATLSPILNGDASFRVTGNSVNSAVIVVDFYLVRSGALRASSGGGGGAPADATYITQTANATLTNEQAMGTLATGLVKNTTTTGVQSIVVPGTGVETWLATPSGANLASALTTSLPVSKGGNPSFTAAGGPVLTYGGMWPFSSNNGAFTATANVVSCHYAPALYSGTVSKIMFWRTAGGSANKGIAVGVYVAGTLSLQGNVGATVPGTNEQSVALSSSQTITAGTVYELCYANEENNAPKNIFFATSDGNLYNQNSELRSWTCTEPATNSAALYSLPSTCTKTAAANAPMLMAKP